MGSHHSSNEDDSTLLHRVPLFPLPNVVLLPRAVLPLHIFEHRYRSMTIDAINSDGHIAMALLKPGWEKEYYSKPAIEPVVCVGTILNYEQLPDGKFNFLLQGRTRAKVVEESPHNGYRVATLQPIADSPPAMEIDLLDLREKLTEKISDPRLSKTPLYAQFAQMLTSTMGTSDIADLIAFNWIEDISRKQQLLAESNPQLRVQTVIDALSDMIASIPLADPSIMVSDNFGRNINLN